MVFNEILYTMISFKQYLLETRTPFMSPVKYKWSDKGPNQWSARFTIGDAHYVVIMGESEDSDTRWDVVFDLENRPINSEPYSMTGTGNVDAIFSTITVMIKELITERPDIMSIVFSADKPSRQKYYERWAEHLAHLLGWSLRTVSRVSKFFILSRPKQLIR